MRKVISSKFYLYLYIWYGLVYYSIIKETNFTDSVTWITMIMMDIYCIMGIAVFAIICKKWKSLTKIARWQLFCWVYPWSLIFVMCLGGSFPERTYHLKWVWFTVVNHGIFLWLCWFLFKNKSLLAPFFSNKIQI